MEGATARQEDRPLHVVVGATGPLGTWLVRQLVDRGLPVRAVSRSGGGEHGPGVQSAAADAADPEGLTAACEGAAVIYHAMNTPYPVWQDTLPSIMEGMITAAERTGAKLVYGDNVYAYGRVDAPLTEDLPWAAATKKGRIRADLLRRLFQAQEEGKVRATVGMASDFYGPHVFSSHLGEFLVPRLLEGKAGQFVGNPDLPHSYTHIRDFARDLVTLAGDERADGRTWHTTVAPARTTRENVRIIADELGVQPKLMTLPRWLFPLLGLFDATMREMQEMLYQFHRPFIVDDSRFRETFAATPTPLEEGLRETARWYRDRR